MTTDDSTRERLESLLDSDGVTVEDLRRGVAELDADEGSETNDRGTTSADGHGFATASALKAGGLLGLVGFASGFATPGAASQNSGPQGKVGTASQPLRALYTAELNGPITGDAAVTDLAGDGLTVDSGTLSAVSARPDVDGGGSAVANVPQIEFGEGLTVTDDGDGTVTVGLDRTFTLSVFEFDIGERGAGEKFTVPVSVGEATIDDIGNVRLTAEDVTVALAITDGNGNTEYDQQLTTDVPPGGRLVTFGIDGNTDKVGSIGSGDYTATVTVEAANADSATTTDTFTVRQSSLDVRSFSIPDQPVDESFTVDATVAETDDSQTQNLTVTLTVDAPDGTTVYDQTIEPPSELKGTSTTVTFGEDDATPEVGTLSATGEYTATVTAEVTNGGPASATDAFTVAGHASAPADLTAVLDGMVQDADGIYVVTDDHELQAMAADLSAEYRLGNDIDASYTDQWNGGEGFEPVGRSSSDRFDGHFDGDQFGITGLTIKPSDGLDVGLFNLISADASIEAVTLDGVDVTGTKRVGGLVGRSAGGTVSDASVTGSVRASSKVGGLVGVITDASGTVSGSSSAADVEATNSFEGDAGGLVGRSDADVIDSSATGTVTGNNSVGGLVGYTTRDVANSYATGTIDATGNNVGGLLGGTEGDVTDSFATGSVTAGGDYVGGLVGALAGATTNSYATGTVNGNASVGGLVGVIGGGGLSGSVANSYATGNVTASGSDVGGFVGHVDVGTVKTSYWDHTNSASLGESDGIGTDTPGGASATGLTTEEMQGAEAADNMTGFDFSSIWNTVDAENDDDVSADDYPVLRALDRAVQLEARE